MSTYKFNPKHLYENTNAGLDIIFKYCPQAIGCERTNKQFKLREEEDTASASLLLKEECWIVKDFGDKGYNPIELCRYFTGFSFIEALKYLYSEFNLITDEKVFASETTFKSNPEQEIGWFEVIEAENFKHLDLVGRFVSEKIALEYDFIPVAEYSFVFLNKKNNEKTICTTKATDHYPIFAYKFCDQWAKIYQPLDKKYKHSFVGKKPERHVYGLTRLRAKFQEQMDIFDADIALARKDKDEKLESRLIDEKIAFKLDSVIICSGGSDGLGVASLGHHVIWFNSESEQLNWEEYNELKTLCKEIYNLPDIDSPGTKYGYQVAEMFWNLKTIWLPETIKQFNGKDFRDWLKKYSKSSYKEVQSQFINLRTGALKCKFFERNAKTRSLKIKPSYLHYFLKVKGFYLYYPEKIYLDKSSEQEFLFIRVRDNIINQEFPNTIRKFCEKYLIDKGQPVEVIDLIKSTTQFTDKNLMSLDPIVLDFKNYTSDSQTFYFKNVFATVTANGVELNPYRKLNSHVWYNKIIDHNILPEKPFFEYYKDDKGNDRIRIIRTDCEYMNFLINTSRVFWRKDLEVQFGDDLESAKEYHEKNKFRLNSDFLSYEENLIQEQHFSSKIFALGYLEHKYKSKSFARMVYIMDDKTKENEDERNGGSGKSMILDGLECLLPKRFRIDGMKQNLFADQFILGGVTQETDYILIEDLAEHYQIEFFYNWITGSLEVRPIYKQRFEIDFYDAPKMALTRNYGLKTSMLSTLRRLLFISTSDYYHKNSEQYKEERRVSHDFGHDLFMWNKFKKSDDKQPSLHFGFLFNALQFYLQYRDNEIIAPMDNININNDDAEVGDVLRDWANSYFFEDFLDNGELVEGNLNKKISRPEMYKNYTNYAGKYSKLAGKFKKALKIYCLRRGWELNPKSELNPEGFIKRRGNKELGEASQIECFYIKTNDVELKQMQEVANKVELEANKEEIKKPNTLF